MKSRRNFLRSATALLSLGAMAAACSSTKNPDGTVTKSLDTGKVLSLASSLTTGFSKFISDAGVASVIGTKNQAAITGFLTKMQAIEAEIAASYSAPISITIGQNWVQALLKDADEALAIANAFSSKLPKAAQSLLTAISVLEPALEAAVSLLSARPVKATGMDPASAQKLIALS